MGSSEDYRFGEVKMIFQFYPCNEKSSSEGRRRNGGSFRREKKV